MPKKIHLCSTIYALTFILIMTMVQPAFALTSSPIERVSIASDGTQANGGAEGSAISSDGRYIAFSSSASNLVTGDTNGYSDIFVYDRLTDTTERVSVATDGTQGNGFCYRPDISTDGRFVAFTSTATTLVAGDTNNYSDVFVHDRQNGTTERISVSSSGTEGNHISYDAAISGDGRYVAFSSLASSLVTGDTNNRTDVFVRDRQEGTTERISISSSGAQTTAGHSYADSISADGRYVAMHSSDANLVIGDTNNVTDIFIRDRQEETTERVSIDSSGNQANDESSYAAISNNGRYVTFSSDATNLVAGDTNGYPDVFLHNRQTGTTIIISEHTQGSPATDESYNPSISADGQMISFSSYAALVPEDTNGTGDIYIYFVQTGHLEIVTRLPDGTVGNDESYDSDISEDGRYVTFASVATNLVDNDSNLVNDVFVKELWSPYFLPLVIK